jgi:hypothetical protein
MQHQPMSVFAWVQEGCNKLIQKTDASQDSYTKLVVQPMADILFSVVCDECLIVELRNHNPTSYTVCFSISVLIGDFCYAPCFIPSSPLAFISYQCDFDAECGGVYQPAF